MLEKLLVFSIISLTVVSMFFCVMAGYMLNNRDRYRPLSYKGKRDRRRAC